MLPGSYKAAAISQLGLHQRSGDREECMALTVYGQRLPSSISTLRAATLQATGLKGW